MTRIFVTGAAGFTGRHFAERVADDPVELHGLINSHQDGRPDGYVELYEGDLTDRAALGQIIDTVRPDKVVHLAAIANVAHSDVSEMYQTNIIGTRNLLDALAASAHRPSIALLASSANIYGNAREAVLVEDMPPAPANDYGITKLAMEHVVHVYGERLPIVLVRPFNYTGLGQSEEFLIPKIVGHARRGDRHIELGNLDVARDFSDVRTVVDAYARLLFAPDAAGKTVNVCSGRAVRLREIIDLVGRLSGCELAVSVNPAFVRANEVRSLRGSRAALERLVGPLLDVPLRETLSWMLNG